MITYRCNGCGVIVDKPVLQIARVDGLGGGGVDVEGGKDHHLCWPCGRAIYAALKLRRSEQAKGDA